MMRLRTMSQSWLLVLTAFLFVPSSLRPAHATEALPNIQTTCKTDSQRRLLLMPIRLPPSTYLVEPNPVVQSKKIAALIAAKQWDQAFLEFQQSSTWVQDQTLRSLLVALVQSNETAQVSQFVIEKFPLRFKKSQKL